MSRELQPCGTNAAAERHRRNGEPLCEPCRLARNAAAADWERESGTGRARQRAMTALKDRHLDPFERCRDAARAEEPCTDNKAKQRVYQAALRRLTRIYPEEFVALVEVEMVKEADRA